MNQEGIAIFGIGMVTAVGLNSMQTFASVKAGISRFSETAIYDKQFNPFVMSILPDDVLPPLEEDIEKELGLTSRQMRMLRLASPAIQEAIEDIPDTESIPIFLGVPEQIPDRPEPVRENFIDLLCAQSKVKINKEKSRLFPQGRAAGLVAIKEAMDQLSSGTEKYIIVGGVDTYLDLYLLGTLDMEDRISSPSSMDGFIPGEGAGFLLLGTPDKSNALGKEPIAKLLAASTGFEQGHRYSEKVYQGNGLAETFQTMFSDINSNNKIKTVYAGLNGENFGAKEWGVAYLRNNENFEEEYCFEHPVDCFGDTGSALGPLMTGISAIGLSKNTIEGPCMVWCSSDYGMRSVLTINSI